MPVDFLPGRPEGGVNGGVGSGDAGRVVRPEMASYSVGAGMERSPPYSPPSMIALK